MLGPRLRQKAGPNNFLVKFKRVHKNVKQEIPVVTTEASQEQLANFP